jgi:hypothetical protein
MTRNLILLAAAALALPGTVAAHFVWLVPNAESGRVEVYFAESADPDDPALLDRLKGVVIQQRLPDGKVSKTEAVRKDDWLAITPKNLTGTFALAHEYGVITRGEATFLLNYAAKAYTGPAESWRELAKPLAKLDVVPRREADRLVFEARFDGQPVEGAQVVVDTPDLDRIEGTTDAKGNFSVPVKADGTFAARVRHVESRAGQQDDKAYTDVRHYQTVTLALGETKAPSSKPNPSAKPEKSVKSATLPDLPRGITSFGAAIVGDQVYVYGGNTGTAHEYYREGQSDEFLVLDLAKPKAWKKLGTVPRRQGLAVVPHGRYVYRVGGFEALNEQGGERNLASTRDFARFDTKTGQWEQLADLPEPRSSHDAVVIGDRLYVVGGWSLSTEDSVWLDTALVADLSAKEIRWEQLPNPPFHRRALAAGEHDGRLVVIGGMQEEGGPTTKTSLYDPATKTWSAGPDLIAKGDMGGFGSSAIRLGDDLYVSTYEGSVQRLDAAAGKWTEVAQLEHPRFFHRMLPTADGKLVVVGGASMTTGKVVETEAIDPAANEKTEE